MYSKGYVVAIVCNGQISQESKNGVVALPFNSEYTIRLRNKTNRRAVAKVFVDDENVTEGGIIVPANNFVDLERPTTKAVKFKFVSSQSEEAVDFGKNNKTDGSNGVIRVEWQAEKEYRPVYTAYSNVPYWQHPYKKYLCGGTPRSRLASKGVTTEEATAMCSFDEGGAIPANSSKLSEGCTVEGGYSSQSFTTSYIDLEHGDPVIIQLVLRGFKQSFKKTGLVFCTNCGKKHNRKVNFCSQCGNKLKE